MKQRILDLLEEQGSLDQLLDEMAKAKTDQEILTVAHKIIAKRNEYEWLATKVQQIFGADTA